MGFGFRKLVQLGPGLRVNLSRRGTGLCLSINGFVYSRGPASSRTPISASGTGLAYSTDHHRSQSGGIDSAISGLIVLVTISVWILGWPPEGPLALGEIRGGARCSGPGSGAHQAEHSRTETEQQARDEPQRRRIDQPVDPPAQQPNPPRHWR
jgi:hypothetical protein